MELKLLTLEDVANAGLISNPAQGSQSIQALCHVLLATAVSNMSITQHYPNPYPSHEQVVGEVRREVRHEIRNLINHIGNERPWRPGNGRYPRYYKQYSYNPRDVSNNQRYTFSSMKSRVMVANPNKAAKEQFWSKS